MVAYEFYYRDYANQTQLLGILPERRRDKKRITRESIMRWVKKFLGNDWDIGKINFIEVTINKVTGEVIESKPKEPLNP